MLSSRVVLGYWEVLFDFIDQLVSYLEPSGCFKSSGELHGFYVNHAYFFREEAYGSKCGNEGGKEGKGWMWCWAKGCQKEDVEVGKNITKKNLKSRRNPRRDCKKQSKKV